jgi:hypothetical protein
LFAPFKHCLWGCPKPIPPGYKVNFSLLRNSDDFYNIQSESDNETYTVKLDKLELFVKIAYLQKTIYDELEARLVKEAIKYFLRKVEVRTIPILNINQWQLDNIFNNNSVPIKMFIALVPNSALLVLNIQFIHAECTLY